MKLITIKPIVLEADEDDTFINQELPTNVLELIKILSRREAALAHIKRSTNGDDDEVALKAKGARHAGAYPGGWQQAMADEETGKVIRASKTYFISNTPGNKEIIQQAVAKKERHEKICRQVDKLRTQINKLKREEANKQLAAKQSGKSAGAQIPESKVPAMIHTGKKSKFGNPYFQGSHDRYAGEPAFYSWTRQMLQVYHKLEEILTSHGFDGFTIIYASTVKQGSGKFVSNLYNFAVIGAGGKFMWRKYDMGHGSSQNLVYVAGKKTYLSTMLADAERDPTKLTQLLDTMKQP